MKTIFFFACMIFTLGAFAQVQVDKAIELTGTGTDAKISGIKDVSASQDAVSAEVVQNGKLVFANATGGGSNAFTLSLAPAPASYQAGMMFSFKADAAITGAATVDVNGLGAKSIKKYVVDDLGADDIKANQFVTIIYDGTNFQMLSQLGNVSSGSSGGSGGYDPTLSYINSGF